MQIFDPRWRQIFFHALLLTFFLPLFSPKLDAAPPQSIRGLKGHATLIWKSKKGTYRFDQIVVVKNKREAVFETLDDFGSTVLTIRLTPTETGLTSPAGEYRKKGSAGKIRGLLPIGGDDLIAALLNQTQPPDKKVRISFLDFKKFGRIRYPKIIRIETRKTSLTLEWQDITFQF